MMRSRATRTVTGDTAVITINGTTIKIRRDRKNGRRIRVEVETKLGEEIRIVSSDEPKRD